jgi:exosortase/archaeosortase family protein
MQGRRKKVPHRAATSSTRAAPAKGAVGREPAPLSRGRWWRSERVRFVVAFTLLAGSLLAFYYFPRAPDDTVERWTALYLRAYTHVVSWPIRIFDPHVSAHGNLIAGRFSMQIVKSCDAMEANILFAAAVLAFSGPWLRKVVALFLGLAALLALNLVRLFVLYWVGALAPSAFDFLHLDVWPLLMVVFAVIAFVLSVRWTGAGEVLADEAPAHVAG